MRRLLFVLVHIAVVLPFASKAQLVADTTSSSAGLAKALSYYYGELIKEKRKEKHLTQQQLADQIGKERAYIAKIEQGKTDLQLSNFMQIINALGLSLKIG